MWKIRNIFTRNGSNIIKENKATVSIIIKTMYEYHS